MKASTNEETKPFLERGSKIFKKTLKKFRVTSFAESSKLFDILATKGDKVSIENGRNLIV